MFAADLGATTSSVSAYIEDVFGPYFYTGNGTTQTITTGLDLSTYGGLVWIKGRNGTSLGAADHALHDTARGVTNLISTSLTNAESNQSTGGVTAISTSGFSIGNYPLYNDAGYLYTSWSFRKQANFFDIVTYTGTGSARTIAHNLGTAPGCIIVKRLDAASNWQVYHRSLTSAAYAMQLNLTSAQASAPTVWNSTAPTSSVFSVGTSTTVNASGGTYVAYLFAHDAGGFGAAGTDNVISCGSYTGNGSTTGPVITLGWEPQWLLIKRADGATQPWELLDTMRGLRGITGSNSTGELWANSNVNESSGGADPCITATGFTLSGTNTNYNASGGTYIYMAIRRGPMKTPTTGTSVFSPNTSSAAAGTKITTGFPVDVQLGSDLVATSNRVFVDRLRNVSSNATGSGLRLITNGTGAESSDAGLSLFWDNTGFQMPANFGGAAAVYWNFRRAPGFLDQVCYTGTGIATTFNHNLGAIPELIIVKRRSAISNWQVYAAGLASASYALSLNSTSAQSAAGAFWNSTAPTSSVFSVGTSTDTNASAGTYVAYLFATLAGVSKVGSYTGSGTTKQIDCGFTGGARLVLIKRIDSTGDWYLWDSARGIVAGNDPYVILNSNVAEVTGTDYIDTYSAGFEISSTAPAAINANGGSFIFLAIA